MSSFYLLPKKGTKQHTPQTDLSLLYDQYSSIIYGVVIKVTNQDIVLAQILLTQIFVELSLQKKLNDKTVLFSFSQIIQITSKVAIKYGYPIGAILKGIGFPPKPALPEILPALLKSVILFKE